MARGDGGKRIFIEKEDHESFLHWLERVCQSHGWRVHAWVLMGNHFHLLLETPEPNLSAGMRVLLGTFSQAWNSRYQRRGHVFQGRYKAVPVAGERAADAHYFKSVADYIHLNPARAGLAGGGRGKLADYPWSSLRHYAKGNAPEWQPMDRVLDAFRLSRDRRGRTAYVSWLEARAENEGGGIGEKAMEAIRGGWYLGEEGFKDKLLGLIDKAGAKIRKRGSVAGAAVCAHGEIEAERIIRIVGAELGLAESAEDLELLRKGDPRKVICAALVKGLTSVKNDWLANRLCMGHPAAMSQLVNRARKDPKNLKILKKHEKTFKSKD
jgi:REP element-mobilizing transposase RayT